ncbi:MAG: hypothetical protein NTY63_04340 [Candidatus Bipolaricaulota bacterium]|nr:hypothetical protein [Candidatus Bipolaricaulota bacterium]
MPDENDVAQGLLPEQADDGVGVFVHRVGETRRAVAEAEPQEIRHQRPPARQL